MRRYWRENSYKVPLSDDIDDTENPLFSYEISEEEDYDEFKPVYPLESFKKAFSQLPEGYQKVLWLFYVEKRTYRQIADELGISIGTVKSRLNRAKVKLKEMLENETRGDKG